MDEVAPGPGPVLRLTVRLDRNGAELVDVVRVERMALPRSRPLPPIGGDPASGQWFELRDDDDRVLYRRAFRTTTLQGHEQFDADGTITRQAEPGEPHAEEIEILVPSLEAATQIRFVSDHQHRGERLAAPETVGTIRLPDRPRPARKGRRRG